MSSMQNSSLLSHVINKHDNLDEPLYNKCNHGEIKHRTWLDKGEFKFNTMGSGIEWELRRPRKSWARGKNLQSSSVYLVLFESHSHCGSVEKSMTILVSH